MKEDMTTPLLIIQVVFSYFGVPIEMKDNPTRKREKVMACQYSMYFLRAYTRLSLAEAGALFGRDHATTLHSCKKLNFEISKYKDARQDAQSLELKINDKIKELHLIIQKALDDVFERKYAHYNTDLV
jgi:chromosomal replication initiation ATPase DnaA